VSALAQTGAELGGALGIAVLGSLGTAIYRGMLGSALPAGIPADLSETARDTLGGALSVAAQLTDPVAAAALTLTAQAALTTALHASSAIGFVISMASAIAAAIYLRDRKAPEPVEAPCPAGA
jgi:DHA2 family multidrug resistance protein-like MFS transporter